MRIDPSLNAVFIAAQDVSYGAAVHDAEVTPLSPHQGANKVVDLPTITRSEPRDIVEFQGIEIDLSTQNNTDQDADQSRVNSRALSPREMADFSLDLYIDGALSFDEYSLLAFQPELHPQFEQTIGALTGEQANPDQPRDYLQEWQDRYSFERRYPSDSPKTLERIERIINVLSVHQGTIDHVA